ncbi:sulfite exporter TauE/SafE family protein [Cognatishimia sp. F0-27]|uniref:sulfite exporter TauE/SafE family protein n=1 Tax=Cognatishimia sp. F0-27 TaxID=2816855 RepID=UPI001D0C5D2E|nr:sulfite exporter TauE/SafE family protein [Cognatishimia sp. F0-27]MCC1491603.1 sulfite exporter TauE/SafE family protein [Cognatishimia sp. F0-27]
MPDWLVLASQTDGIGWVAAAAFMAGLVRGFSGFGTAMVFLPVAGQFVPPVWAVVVLVIMDAFGPLPNLPRAWRDADLPDLRRLLLATFVMLPLGLLVLNVVSEEVFRSVVGGVALLLLVCLVAGLRYRGTLRASMVYGIGAVGGFLGGAAGMPGPPIIFFYMASPLGPATIRGNTMLYLYGFDLMLIGLLALSGGLVAQAVGLGLIMAMPLMLGNLLGAAIFRPERERLYRSAAYLIIAVSALSGLPIWG